LRSASKFLLETNAYGNMNRLIAIERTIVWFRSDDVG
jgi:hypothetical protein